MGKKHKKEKHHRHTHDSREGEQSLKLVLKVPSSSSAPASLPPVPEVLAIPPLTLPAGIGAAASEHKKKKKKKKSQHDEAASSEGVRKKHKTSALAAGPPHQLLPLYPALDKHGIPIGEPPALISAASLKPKHHHRHHHHHHGEATSTTLLPDPAGMLPPIGHYHPKKKKSKKRKHDDEPAPSQMPVPSDQPPSKKLKLPSLVSSSGTSSQKKESLKLSVSSAHDTASPKASSPRITATNASPTAAQSTALAHPSANEMTATMAAPASPVPPVPQSIHPLKLKALLQHVHKILKKKDTHDFFQEPVSDDFAPGYSRIIKKPMDFETMQKKVDGLAYQSITEYREDFETMCQNCMTYNAPDTVYYKAAGTLLRAGLKIINRDRSASLAVPAAGGCLTLQSGSDEIYSAPHSPLGMQLSGEMGDMMMPAPGDSLSPSAAKVHKKRPSAQTASQLLQKQMVLDITRQAQEAAAKAAERVERHKFGFLQKDDSGQVEMSVFHSSGVGTGAPVKKLVDIAPPPPKDKPAPKPGDRRRCSAVSALTTGPFNSFAPIFDSTFAQLSAEESDLLYPSYGNQPSFHYAQSVRSFVKDLGPSQGLSMVDQFLNQLTEGGHDKCLPIVKRLTSEREKKLNKPELVTLTQQKKIEKTKQQRAAATIAAAAAKSKSPEKKAAAASTPASSGTADTSAVASTRPKAKPATAGATTIAMDMSAEDIKGLESLGIDVSFLNTSPKDAGSGDGSDAAAAAAAPAPAPAAAAAAGGQAAQSTARPVKEEVAVASSAESNGALQATAPSPSIVLHSPSNENESVATPSSTDLALLNNSLADMAADGSSALPSAAASPAAASSVAGTAPSPSALSRTSSSVMFSDASPSGSAPSSPGLPSLSAMLERQLEGGDSGSEKNEESMDMDGDSSPIAEGDEGDEESAVQSQLKTNAEAIVQLVDMQSQRLAAVAEQALSSAAPVPAAITAPSQQEDATASSLASGLTQLAAQAPPIAVLPNQTCPPQSSSVPSKRDVVSDMLTATAASKDTTQRLPALPAAADHDVASSVAVVARNEGDRSVADDASSSSGDSSSSSNSDDDSSSDSSDAESTTQPEGIANE